MCLRGLFALLGISIAVADSLPSYTLAGSFLNQENKRLIDVAAAGEAGHPIPAPGSAPDRVCRSRSEACGFYTYDPRTKRPLKWVSSWCRCSLGEECVFGSRARNLYKHVCLPVIEEGDIRNGQQLVRLY